MNDKPENKPLAHVRQDERGDWHEHLLDEHLQGVAVMAADFAADFNSSDWANLAGLWHDLGKYREAFQHYIKKVSGYDAEAHIEGALGRVDHSTAGAIHAMEKLGMHGRILAYLIAGHHAGLPDWNSAEEGQSSLFNRIEEGKRRGYLQEALLATPPPQILDQPCPTSLPPHPDKGAWALWIRMQFSCLVDADFLDTEFFMDGHRATLRTGYPSLKNLFPVFNQYMSNKAAKVEDTPVNRMSNSVQNFPD